MGHPIVSNDNSTPNERSSDGQRVRPAGVLAAVGNEEGLFGSALDRSDEEPGSFADLALYELTAREVAHACLHGAVRAGTRTAAPHSCSTMQGGQAASHSGTQAHEVTVPPCEKGVARIEDRLQQAKQEGDLPREADPSLLARYLITLADGIAAEAGYGVDADELHQIADVALQAWPSP